MVSWPFRQAGPLAEGPRSAEVKEDFTIPHPLRQPRQLAEGVEFPERYEDFSLLWPRFGGGGLLAGLLPIGGDFEPCRDSE